MFLLCVEVLETASVSLPRLSKFLRPDMALFRDSGLCGEKVIGDGESTMLFSN